MTNKPYRLMVDDEVINLQYSYGLLEHEFDIHVVNSQEYFDSLEKKP